MSTAPSPPGLVVRPILGRRSKIRHHYMVGGGMAPRKTVYAFNSTIVNLQKAIKERVFYVKDDTGKFVPPPYPNIGPYRRLYRGDRLGVKCSVCELEIKWQKDVHVVRPFDPQLCLPEHNGKSYCQECVADYRDVFSDDPQLALPPVRNIFDERLGSVQRRILERVPYYSPVELLDFPKMYQGKKRTVYENAVKSLLNRSLTRKDGYTKNFTKTERTLKDSAVPRNISPRDPRYNVKVGLYLKKGEPILLGAVNKMLGSKTIMKGMNAAQVGKEFHRKWLRFGGDGNAVAIGLDASRFDQHVSDIALKFEHKFWLHGIADPARRKELATLLSWQIENTGFGRCRDGTIKYKVLGTRCSGDMNTGSGNCLLASSMLIAYCEKKGVPFELANNGDDCVIFTHKKFLKRFSDGLHGWFVDMGFNMVVEDPVYVLEKVVFCQSQPVYDGANWVMVRDPRTCIAKDCVSLKPWRNAKEYTSWINAVGQSGTALAGGIPVLDPFYRSFVRAGDGAKPLSLNDPTLTGGLFWLSKGMNRRNFKISPEARFSFWLAFGLSPDDQVAIERGYNSTTPFYQQVVRDPEVLPVHEHGLLLR